MRSYSKWRKARAIVPNSTQINTPEATPDARAQVGGGVGPDFLRTAKDQA